MAKRSSVVVALATIGVLFAGVVFALASGAVGNESGSGVGTFKPTPAASTSTTARVGSPTAATSTQTNAPTDVDEISVPTTGRAAIPPTSATSGSAPVGPATVPGGGNPSVFAADPSTSAVSPRRVPPVTRRGDETDDGPDDGPTTAPGREADD